jgi:hypothetical protein
MTMTEITEAAVYGTDDDSELESAAENRRENRYADNPAQNMTPASAASVAPHSLTHHPLA